MTSKGNPLPARAMAQPYDAFSWAPKTEIFCLIKKKKKKKKKQVGEIFSNFYIICYRNDLQNISVKKTIL